MKRFEALRNSEAAHGGSEQAEGRAEYHETTREAYLREGLIQVRGLSGFMLVFWAGIALMHPWEERSRARSSREDRL